MSIFSVTITHPQKSKAKNLGVYFLYLCLDFCEVKVDLETKRVEDEILHIKQRHLMP